MTRRCFLVFWGCLLFPRIAVLATIPQRQWVRAYYPSVPCTGSFVAPATTSYQITGNSFTGGDSQPLSTTMGQDTAKRRRNITESMVKQRAWIYSAILPGWGQVYNAHYWKVPVIYLGFAGVGWGVLYYHKEYVKFKRRLIEKKGNDSLQGYVSECRQSRDFFIFFTALWYIVNILDAYVGASLKTFTLSDDISMEVQPRALPTIHQVPHIGLNLTLRFGA